MTPLRKRTGTGERLWAWLVRAGIAAGTVLALSLPALPATADDLADFEAARAEYDAQHFDAAARLFEDLVLGPVPRVRNLALRLESRKYLGAAYLFLGREDEARDQFRELLEEDPTYNIDPLSFPSAVQTTFDEARGLLEAQQREAERLEAERANEEDRQRLIRVVAEQERLRRLEELANYETIVLPNSRALASMPFGVGQFRNGNRTFGATLAAGQLALLAGSVGTYIGLRSLLSIAAQCGVEAECPLERSPPGAPATASELQFIDRERRVRVSN
jgi:tetratricopeptide (TPR) repeat protein